MNIRSMEIERKFLVIPPLELDKNNAWAIIQSYISFDPEIRIREQRHIKTGLIIYSHTEKGIGDICRTEKEISISKIDYETYRQLVIGNTIKKIRFFLDGLSCKEAVLDIYNDFVIFEAEFYSLEEAGMFIMPSNIRIIREVTEDPAYKCKNIARRS